MAEERRRIIAVVGTASVSSSGGPEGWKSCIELPLRPFAGTGVGVGERAGLDGSPLPDPRRERT